MNLDRSTSVEGKGIKESEAEGSATQDFCNWDGFDDGVVDKNRRQRKTLIQPVETKSVSDKVRRLAVESYQEMLKNNVYGDACLVQKCYIMIGTRPEEQSLIFCALQQIIDLEREVSYEVTCDQSLRSHFCFHSFPFLTHHLNSDNAPPL